MTRVDGLRELTRTSNRFHSVVGEPRPERRHPADVFPGMMFYFVACGDSRPDPSRQWLHEGPYTVVGTCYDLIVGWEALLLGPTAVLERHEGHLGWIRRVVDPVWDERKERCWGTRLADTMGAR